MNDDMGLPIPSEWSSESVANVFDHISSIAGVDASRYDKIHNADSYTSKLLSESNAFSLSIGPKQGFVDVLDSFAKQLDLNQHLAGSSLEKLLEMNREIVSIQRRANARILKMQTVLQGLFKSPSPSEAKQALDKATKKFEKEKYKQKGTLALRAIGLENTQRNLQEAAVEYASTMQTAREHREVNAIQQIFSLYSESIEAIEASAAVIQKHKPDFKLLTTRLSQDGARISGANPELANLKRSIKNRALKLSQSQGDLEKEEKLLRKGKGIRKTGSITQLIGDVEKMRSLRQQGSEDATSPVGSPSAPRKVEESPTHSSRPLPSTPDNYAEPQDALFGKTNDVEPVYEQVADVLKQTSHSEQNTPESRRRLVDSAMSKSTPGSASGSPATQSRHLTLTDTECGSPKPVPARKAPPPPPKPSPSDKGLPPARPPPPIRRPSVLVPADMRDVQIPASQLDSQNYLEDFSVLHDVAAAQVERNRSQSSEIDELPPPMLPTFQCNEKSMDVLNSSENDRREPGQSRSNGDLGPPISPGSLPAPPPQLLDKDDSDVQSEYDEPEGEDIVTERIYSVVHPPELTQQSQEHEVTSSRTYDLAKGQDIVEYDLAVSGKVDSVADSSEVYNGFGDVEKPFVECLFEVWAACTPNDENRVDGSQLRPILETSGLPLNVLGDIWIIVDEAKMGSLSYVQTGCLLGLLSQAQRGKPLDVNVLGPQTPSPHLEIDRKSVV